MAVWMRVGVSVRATKIYASASIFEWRRGQRTVCIIPFAKLTWTTLSALASVRVSEWLRQRVLILVLVLVFVLGLGNWLRAFVFVCDLGSHLRWRTHPGRVRFSRGFYHPPDTTRHDIDTSASTITNEDSAAMDRNEHQTAEQNLTAQTQPSPEP